MPPGFQSKAGFAREAITFSKVWPSASPAVITRPLNFLSEDVNIALDQQFVVTRDTQSTPEFNQVIRQSVPGQVLINANYEGMEPLFSAAMGHEAPRISGVLMPEEITPGVSYRHFFEFDRDLNQRGWTASQGFIAGPQPVGDGLIANQQKIRRGTFAVLKNGVVWETSSAMIDQLTVQVSPAGVVVQFDLLGYDITYGTSVNGGLSALLCDTSNRILFQHATLSVIPAGGDIEDGLIPEITGFQMQIANNLQGINTRETKKRMEEPQAGGARTVTGGFSLPRWTFLDFLPQNQDNFPVHMRLQCFGDPIPGGAGEAFEMTFWFPSVVLTGAQVPVSGPGQILQNYSYMALSRINVPAGFPVPTRSSPVFVEIVNTNSDHTLLD